jgi:hypothetical protein
MEDFETTPITGFGLKDTSISGSKELRDDDLEGESCYKKPKGAYGSPPPAT